MNSFPDSWLLSLLVQVVQVAAKTLGIPMELIKIKPTNTLVNANDAVTGGSLTSEVVCQVCNPHIEIQHSNTGTTCINSP